MTRERRQTVYKGVFMPGIKGMKWGTDRPPKKIKKGTALDPDINNRMYKYSVDNNITESHAIEVLVKKGLTVVKY